jgi:hypothetical protein
MLTLIYHVHVMGCVLCVDLVTNRHATLQFHFVYKKQIYIYMGRHSTQLYKEYIRETPKRIKKEQKNKRKKKKGHEN